MTIPPTANPHRVPYRGPAFRCVPDNGPIDVEALVSTDGESDRWNHPGQPTLYLALDPAVAVAEAGRHFDPPSEPEAFCQRLLRVDVDATDFVDLRDEATLTELGVDGAPFAFLDRERARDVAGELRRDGAARGLIVPSAAFLDDQSRGNLVLFMERAGRVSDVVTAWTEIGRIDVGVR
jgi:RES domain-containing protein